jgi:DNA polymerase III subunit delta
MTAIQPRSVEAFLRKPDLRLAIVLLYGPDAGLVSERARKLVASSVDDPADPFQLVRLDGDDIAADPARLSDEALTVPLFGGRRALWLRAGAKSLAPALEPLLEEPPEDCLIVIEGGDWKKSHALVSLLERARTAAVIACYGDEGASIQSIIAEEVAASGLAIAPEARDALLSLLGGDRLASRAELRKLTLYAHGAGRIELSDVEAVVGDASAFAADAVVDCAFSGRPAELDRGLVRAFAEGSHPSVLAGAALRHALLLHRFRAEVDKGRAAGSVVEQSRGQVHRRRQASVAAQLAHLTQERLDRIVAELAGTVLEVRRNAALGPALVSRSLMRIALATRPQRR